MILKARGPGKFCSLRTIGVKVGKMDQISRKVPSGERYLNFLGPAGRVHSHPKARRKSKISRLKIILFRGDVSVFGVVINIARHSIGRNKIQRVVLYYIILESFVYWQIRF